MRELERDFLDDDPACHSGASTAPGLRFGSRSPTRTAPRPSNLSRSTEPDPPRVLALVGQGRLGTALAAALADSAPRQWELAGPFGRGYDGGGADAVLLCVPDGEIVTAAAAIRPCRLVGHCSGATRLNVLTPHEAFSFHPLLPVAPRQSSFQGAGAAIAGTSPAALDFAASLARALGMNAIEVEEEDRAAYHAAASIASNFLITLESAAEQLAASAGVSRQLLVPLVRATVDNWAALGPARALTGPVARGDEATLAAQRAAVKTRAPELLTLFDELVDATRQVAARHRARELEPTAA